MDVNKYRTICEKVFSMNIILAQIKIKKNYKKNLHKIMKITKSNKFDILVFPELSLTSYNLKKVIKIDKSTIFKPLKEIQNIINDTQIVIVGTIVYKNNKIYNASAIISSKKIEYYFKNTLTEYDEKYFKSGTKKFIFKFKNNKIGLLICRDQDNVKLINNYKKEKCDILLHQSAHYYNKDTAIKKLDKNIAMPIVRAIDSNSLFCKVNSVGKNKNKISLGSSMIIDTQGCVLRKANQFKEEILKLKIKD
jgi:predicted amidohydrolase